MRAALLCLIGLTCAGNASAGSAGIYLSWNDCWPGVSASDTTTFACDTNVGQHDLVAGFMLDQPVDSVIGMEAVIDVQHADATLPDWWRFESGGCRETFAQVSVDFAALTGCTNPWGTVGSGLLQNYIPGQPRGGLNQARMLVVAFVSPSDSARSMQAGQSYSGFIVELLHQRSSGFNPCQGCATDACLVLNSIALLTLPGGAGSVFLSTPGGGGANQVTWQGTAASCSAVPVVRCTWGQVKGMYR